MALETARFPAATARKSGKLRIAADKIAVAQTHRAIAWTVSFGYFGARYFSVSFGARYFSSRNFG